jgi:phosphatidylinositol glycan class N
MMVLMLFKILSPFLLVSAFWRGLLSSRTDVERNFGILLLLCQGMGLHMFFRVTNQGSWLEIGTSISHFVIVQSTTLFLFLLHFVANFLVTFELLRSEDGRFPKVSKSN